jgi:hypothetical protein
MGNIVRGIIVRGNVVRENVIRGNVVRGIGTVPLLKTCLFSTHEGGWTNPWTTSPKSHQLNNNNISNSNNNNSSSSKVSKLESTFV